jgi:hypothetical protein
MGWGLAMLALAAFCLTHGIMMRRMASGVLALLGWSRLCYGYVYGHGYGYGYGYG